MRSLNEFFQDYPAPPPIPKGTRRVTTITLSEDEWELLTRVANHPDSNFKGTLSSAFRWLLYHWLEEADGLQQEGKLVHYANKLRGNLLREGMEIGLHEVDDYLDKEARGLMLFIECDKWELALDHWRILLRFTRKQPRSLRLLLRARSFKHPGIQQFRATYTKYDPHALEQVESEEDWDVEASIS